MSDTVSAQLYLALPDATHLADLGALIDAHGVACVRLSVSDAGAETVEAARKARISCHERDIPLVIAGEADTALSVADAAQADGVHLVGVPKAVPWVRERLGEDAIVGIDALDSRHDGLIAAESGADYVTFAPDWTADDTAPEEILWWAQMIETPMVIETAQTPQRAKTLKSLAEFICVTPENAPAIASALS